MADVSVPLVKDNSGRHYARLSAVRAGHVLQADADFDCLQPDALCDVQADRSGELYVPCRAGRHYLDGQLCDVNRDSLVGFYPAPLAAGAGAA